MSSHRSKRVCYILSYYAPGYVRTRTLVAALKLLKSVDLYQARNTKVGWFQYIQTLFYLIKIRFSHNPELYVLGFRGYEIYWLVRLLTIRKKLIIDHLMSPYDSLVNEKKRVRPGTLLAKLIYKYEKSILSNADYILTDTALHKNYLSTSFNISPQKIIPVPVGADEALFNTETIIKKSKSEESLTLLFYGSFLPLHGIDIILEASKRVKDLPIKFTLVGGKHTGLASFHDKVARNNLRNVTHYDWVAFNHLPMLIAQHDLGLGGPFGNTGQGQRVITGKTFQLLAMGKPTIIGEIAQDFGFVDKKNCLLVPQGDVDALVSRILWAYHHRESLPALGKEGQKLYQNNFSIDCIRRRLEFIYD